MTTKKWPLWAIIIALLLSVPQAASAFMSSFGLSHPAGTVSHCFDGDTMKLNDRRVVRLAGIDAPEVPHGGKKAQYYSREAKRLLEDLAKGEKIELVFPGVSPKDSYGRLICDARLSDGRSLNQELVAQGAAFFYPHRDLTPDFQEKLLELQTEAIKERRGMWDKILEMPIARQPYIGNQQSLRFFPADCPEAQTILPRNRVHFGNLMDAFLAGYAPARICPFWPEIQKAAR